jgi:hypothetical protein
MRGLIVLTLLMMQGQGPRYIQLQEGVKPKIVVVPKGTAIPVALVNRLSTKNLAAGAGIYARTIVPITASNQIVIPVGSNVNGKVIEVERAGRVKGKPSLKITFHSVILPSGVTLPLYGSLGGSDTGVRKGEATIEGESQKGKDVEDITGRAGTGAIGGAIFRGVKGAGVGAGAGAVVGLGEVLLKRGDDLTLERGPTIEVILDQDLEF